ncbi:MAG: SDR family oxidoreductase [Bacteroidota bacterium]
MTPEKQTFLITGATSGIGRVTAEKLAALGGTVVITSRDASRGRAAADQIIHTTGNKKVHMMSCDLSDLSSVRQFATDFLSRFNELHVLINNAGTWEMARKTSTDGYELNLATNHLGPFLLTNLLLERLKQSAPSRIITVASSAHKRAHINFKNIHLEYDFTWFKGYSQSKLMNILFTKSLDKRLVGTGVTANCLHPGLVRTSIFKNMNGFNRFIIPFSAIPPEKGAETTIFLATSNEVATVSGKYFAKKKITASSSESNKMEVAEELWTLSEKLSGLTVL